MKCVCKNDQVQLPVILRIFEENQNPVAMHTSIMCINILLNIKAVAPKLKEEVAGQTMYLYPDGRMDRGKLICPPTLHHRGITSLLQFISVIFGEKSEILKTNRCKRRTQSDDNTRHGHLVQLRQERTIFTYPHKALDLCHLYIKVHLTDLQDCLMSSESLQWPWNRNIKLYLKPT